MDEPSNVGASVGDRWYMTEADRVNSGMYFAENVGADEFIVMLRAVIHTTRHADKFKKVVFRGRTREQANLPPLFHGIALYQRIPEEHKDLVHGIVGMITEVGELAEILLDMAENGAGSSGYCGPNRDGQPDVANVREECGDNLWYMNRIMRWAKTTFGREMKRNLDKLFKRHGETFDADRDVNRDLSEERKVLEE